MTEKNDLFDFFKQATDLMQSEYDRIARRSKEDPGTAGDEGEENWATLIEKWIPQYYYVVRKGQILFPDGSCSPQMDVLILRPEYPPNLVKSRIKKYMAHCVAAAFECKLTLRSSDLKKVFRTSSFIKNKQFLNPSTPYQELHSPIIFGLLSHCFDSEKNKTNILECITKKIYNCDKMFVKYPKEMPDILCVANIGTWITSKISYFDPSKFIPDIRNEIARYFKEAPCTITGYSFQPEIKEQSDNFTPIGAFISVLTNKLAWRDRDMQNIARYYRMSNVEGSGRGILNRVWQPKEIYSKNILEQLINKGVITEQHWNEWSYFF